MVTKTIDIICSECDKTITMSAKDAHIVSRLNGGCPRLSITVQCPHCGKSNIVHESPEAHDLLDERIKNRDYDFGGATIIVDHPETLNRVLGNS